MKEIILTLMMTVLLNNTSSAMSFEKNFQLAKAEQKEEENIYEDWEVDKFKDIVRYSTHGKIVHGHRFGWIKIAGNCDKDILATNISTQKKIKIVCIILKEIGST